MCYVKSSLLGFNLILNLRPTVSREMEREGKEKATDGIIFGN